MTRTEYIKTRKLLSNPLRWNRGRYAVDCFGMRCLAHDPNAIRWCALSACNKFANKFDYSRKELLLAAKQLNFTSITHLNDNGTHADVMKMFELAIGFSS